MARVGDISADALTCQIVGCAEEAAGWCETAERPPKPAMIDLCERHMGMLRGDTDDPTRPVAEAMVLEWSGEGLIFAGLWPGNAVELEEKSHSRRSET